MIRTSRPNWKLVVVLIAVMGIMALTSLGSAPPVRAQGGYDWSITYNFLLDNGGWSDIGTWTSGGPSTWVSGTGWTTGDGENPANNFYRLVWIKKDFASTTNIQHVKVTFDYTFGAMTCTTCGINWIIFDVDAPHTTLSDYIAGTNVTQEWTGVEFTNTLQVAEVPYYCVSTAPGSSCASGPTYSGYARIKSVLVEGGGTPPESAPTTPTPPPGGVGTSGGFIGLCPFLGDGVATFSNLSAWTLTAGESGTMPSAGTPTGLKLEDGKASIQVSLSKYRTYRIDAKFHVLGDPPVAGDLFEIAVGTTTNPTRVSVPAEATAGTQTFSQDTSISTPDTTVGPSEIYNLSIEEKIGAQNLNIDYVCLTDTTVVSGPVVPTGGDDSPGACVSCVYHASGDLIADIIGIFKWLWCGLVNLFTCVLFPALRGIWTVAQNALSILGVARQWLGLVFDSAGTWLGDIFQKFGRWFSGTFGNGVQGLLNAVLTVLSPGGAILNWLIHQLVALFEPGIRQAAGTAATVVQTIGTGFELALYYIGRFIYLIGLVISAVPTVIGSLIAGFNAGPASIPVWAPTCNNSANILYYPCLGFYVADNTVLDGPIYYAFILILGMIGVNVLLWAIRATQEALA